MDVDSEVWFGLVESGCELFGVCCGGVEVGFGVVE